MGMDHYPVTLGIARPLGKAKHIKGGSGSSGSALPSGKVDKDLKAKIFERDNYTCKCCGFRSEKYQDIHFKNRNKLDHSEGNLLTMCIFCNQCFNLEDVGQMRSGVLIWLPEIEQTTLNHIARAIYVARISQGAAAEAARKSLDTMMERRAELKNRIGTDDPFILSNILSDYLGDKHYHLRAPKLEGIRLFPLDRRIIKESELEFNQFPQILAYWRSKNGPFGGKLPTTWVGMYKTILGEAA